MKKTTFIISTLILMLSACGNDPEQLNKDISVPVSVMDITPQRIEEYITITGNVMPVKEGELKTEMPGQYYLLVNPKTNRSFALGDRVEKGQEVVRLEDKEYENNIKLSSLKLNLDITKQTYEKQQSLYDKGGVTLNELKQAEINYENAKYSYEDAMIRLAKMHIKTPFSGVIVDLPYYTPGIRVEAGVPVFKVMDYSKLYMEVSLPEKNMKDLKTNQQVRVMNYTASKDTLKGRITQLSPAIDPETRTFTGIISVDNPKLTLRPGMFAKGEIIIAAADSALVIPREIILSKQSGDAVFIVDNGFASERILTFGLENPENVQVISGLNRKDKIVVKGFETLRDRSRVKIVR
ncbi:MAG TPA: efflux RND transporter periplasmic adaptor subunit [Bacteroidales bacterium]|nr:efflux RND transporter periplasmic adaptor subunit [Bacteroidales bacterium]